MNGAGAQGLLGALGRGAFPFAYDPQSDSVRLIALSAEEIARAAFLDQRVLTPQTTSEQAPFALFEKAALALPGPAPNMIFHMGHCGSTLLSKLLAAASGAAAFREPMPLRSLAAEWADAETGDSFLTKSEIARRFGAFLMSWSRGPGTTVKASSMCTDLLAPFLASRPDARAAFLYLKPEAFIAVMLGGENNRNDLVGFAKIRRRRLARHAPDVPPLARLSPGELAALVWLVEAAAAARARGPALRAIDFDAFLEAPAQGLAEAAAHLDVPAIAPAIDAAIHGPLMRSYSKAPEHEFTPAARKQFMALYRDEHRAEIAKGMALIAKAGASAPAALDAFGG
jgi:hypothetical protein